MSRMWIVDASEQRHLGHADDDGLVILDDLPRVASPLWWPVQATLALHARRSRLTWWRWTLATGQPGPGASRAKREYRRRHR
ncbi:hypothetical protein [Nonomuraea angiospora]|uniref:hypothetical protein n=1 Tax=Nonomuraea angiospora TaxID=46172 RepID=UPI0029AF4C4C|nr:hypothetical protein [Nonomuraea angiospora]MDX3100469.1 hypothetical protein [Nonomuraea angiospora]